MPPVINEERCRRCGTCADLCMSDVFYGSNPGNVPTVTYPDECWHCNACVRTCPVGAVSLRIPVNFHIMRQARSHCND